MIGDAVDELPADDVPLVVIGGAGEHAAWRSVTGPRPGQREPVYLGGAGDLRRVMGMVPPFRVVLLPGRVDGLLDVLDAVRSRALRSPAFVDWLEWDPATDRYTTFAV